MLPGVEPRACSNKLTIKLDDVERIFFSELQQYALSPNGIDQVLGEFVRQLEVASSERDVTEKQLEAERGNNPAGTR